VISGAELLEQAVSLCGGNRTRAMTAYWVGTAPFVTAVLYFCQTIVSRSNADEQIFPLSLILTVLWMWMNFWHTVFCDGLWSSVSGEPETLWSFGVVSRVLRANAALQGSGLFLLGIAALITLPFPWAHAFLQNCHVFAPRQDLLETARRAGQHASSGPKQNWQLLSCVLFLGAMLFLNTMLAIFLGAQLLNTIFGIQTVLVQNRMAIFGLPFLATAACLTFLFMDPVWKAAHVLRCFHGESKRSGADLRLFLRRVAVVLLFVAATLEARAQTAPNRKYDSAIKEVLQRPEYDWTGRGETLREPPNSAFHQQLQVWLSKAAYWIGQLLRRFSPQPQRSNAETAPGSGLLWSVIAALAVCAAVVAILVLRSRARQRLKPSLAESIPAAVAVDITDESLSPEQLPANEWLQLADKFLRDGDTRSAARAVYLAALSQLDTEKLITLGRHKTNLEYENELKRRGRSVPHVCLMFRRIAETFERSWYGLHRIDEQLVLELRSSLTTLRGHA
jgi:hypothetical protein